MKANKKKPRNSEVLGMVLNCRSRKFRHRADRRPKDAKRSWQADEP